MADWSKNALAIDIAYSNIISDYAQFVKNEIQIAFIKLSQGNYIYDKLFDTHWHMCKEAGMYRGAYHIFDPRNTPVEQLNWIKHYYPASEADLPITIDCEDLPGLNMASYSNQFLIKQIGNLWGLLTREYGKKPIIYTGGWWWNAHMLPAPSWIADADFWVAGYPFAAGRVNVTLEQFKTDWLPKAQRWIDPVSGGPAAVWWQVTGDKFCLPGVNGPIDIDLFQGSMEDCIARYSLGQDEDHSHEHVIDYPRYVSQAVPFLNIRSGPGKEFADIGDLYPNIPVVGYDEKDNWVKIDPTAEKWVYKPYLRKAD